MADDACARILCRRHGDRVSRARRVHPQKDHSESRHPRRGSRCRDVGHLSVEPQSDVSRPVARPDRLGGVALESHGICAAALLPTVHEPLSD